MSSNREVTERNASISMYFLMVSVFISAVMFSISFCAIPQPSGYKVILKDDKIELFEKNIYYETDINKILTIHRSGGYKTIYQADTWVKIEPVFQIEKN